MKLFIKNMVSIRCKMIVRSELEKLRLHCIKVEFGEVEIKEHLNNAKYNILKRTLFQFGLELMENKKSRLIERIKGVVIEMVHYNDTPPTQNFSTYLSEKLNYDYHYLSNLFSEVKGTTIEQYVISHKIERVKELLVYDEFTLTEIADKLHYSSVAHLSNQFKKVTGLTPSYFKKTKDKRFTAREDL